MVTNAYLFVYGTLRKGSTVKHVTWLTQHCSYVAKATFQGKLYEVNGYPGAVQSDYVDDLVRGEVYQVLDSEKLWPILDAYEECTTNFPKPHEYQRESRPVNLAGLGKINAWIYVFHHAIDHLTLIPSGDYLQFLSAPTNPKHRKKRT